MNTDNFVEIQIELKTTEEQIKVITKLWDAFLKDDDTFHYLYEPGYLLLRFDRAKAIEYKKKLDRRKLKYKYFLEWEETNSCVVNHYKEYFAQYLHLNSVLALSNKHHLDFCDLERGSYGLEEFLERIEHCFYDIFENWFSSSESTVLMMLARDRAFARGIMYGMAKEKRELEKVENQ